MPRRRIELPGRISLVRTLRRLAIFGFDPTQKRVDGAVWCAFRTEDGPATIRYEQVADDVVEAEAHGPGADRALELAPDQLGVRDRPEEFVTDCSFVGPLVEKHAGLRFGRTGRVLERLVPTIIGQKVTGKGAAQSWKELVFRYGERAPEPSPKLWLMPTPERFREMAYYDFHPLGIERKRAQVILDVTRRAKRLERLVDEGPEVLEKRLLAFRGIGPWTTAITIGGVFGDPDAVPVGDYNIPSMVVHALTGKARGDDDEMLELLEPYRPHRGRALALISASGVTPPKFGPRLSVRNIRRH